MLSVFTLLAQNIRLVPDSGIANSVADFNITEWIPAAVNLLFVVAVVIFFFMLVIGGIRWISSGGDKGATEAAKGQITAAIIGLVLVLSAYAIVSILETFFGINIISGLSLTLGEETPEPDCVEFGECTTFDTPTCCEGLTPEEDGGCPSDSLFFRCQ